jgi:hypothetical protein
MWVAQQLPARHKNQYAARWTMRTVALESESEMYILYLMKKQHGFGRNVTETINKRMRPLNVGL